jgi:hypothetical protein
MLKLSLDQKKCVAIFLTFEKNTTNLRALAKVPNSTNPNGQCVKMSGGNIITF